MRVLAWGLAVLLAVSASTVSFAAVSCPDRVPAAITSATAAGLKCQNAIAKVGLNYVKAESKILSKCRTKAAAPAVCPSAADSTKLQLAVTKATDAIAKACGADTAQAGLASSYGSGTDDSVISSCLLSQHNVVGELLVDNATGVSTEAFPSSDDKTRAACVKTLAGEGPAYAVKALQIVGKCVAAQMKLGTAGDLAPVCAGRYSGGTFVPPTDAKAAGGLAKLLGKVTEKVSTKCPDGDYIATLFACPDAATSADLQACLVCKGWDSVLDLAEQEYSETGTFVANGPGALQLALNAGTTDTKLLIGPGTYQEQISVPANGMQLVGCGGASNDRPKVIPPTTGGPYANGISASGLTGLVLQSIEANDWNENGLFVTGTNGVTFRDVHSDGNHTSTYGIFPVQSNNVLIEESSVTGVTDAGIYVGQSTDITVRYNQVIGNVAGLEIENSGNAEVHNNYATGNSGGILVFKLPFYVIQLSNCHNIHHNISEMNDAPNIGMGTVGLVPPGTGMIVLSNAASVLHHNISRKNGTFGIAVTDQVVLDALFSAFGGVYSADYIVANNSFVDNLFENNGGNPAPDIAMLGFNRDTVFVVSPGSPGNCQRDNTFGSDIGMAALPVCPDPVVLPGCPVPPLL